MTGRHSIPWLTGATLALLGVLCGCSNPPPVTETPPPPVSLSQPVVRDVTDYDDYEGRIAAVEMVEVRARVRGHLIKINFKDGEMVKENAPLFEIDPRPFKVALDAANAQKSAAQARLALAKSENARVKRLARTGAVSPEEAEIAAAKELTAQAGLGEAVAGVEKAQLDLDYTKVTAPISGKASRTQVTVGNLINAGGGETLLTTITSVDPMYVYFDVPERMINKYKEHFRKPPKKGEAEPSLKELNIPVLVGLEGEEGYPHKGVIDFADNRVNPSTGTIQVRGVLSNARRKLDAGMRARVRIPVSDPHKSLLITERAVGTDQGRKFVYVVNAENVAERRDVKLGRLSEGLQVILEGLKPEDQVIVNGIQRVRDGAKVEPHRVPMPDAPADVTKQKPSK
jgi:membrane fusion protein, multidrug efflux system